MYLRVPYIYKPSELASSWNSNTRVIEGLKYISALLQRKFLCLEFLSFRPLVLLIKLVLILRWIRSTGKTKVIGESRISYKENNPSSLRPSKIWNILSRGGIRAFRGERPASSRLSHVTIMWSTNCIANKLFVTRTMSNTLPMEVMNVRSSGSYQLHSTQFLSKIYSELVKLLYAN